MMKPLKWQRCYSNNKCYVVSICTLASISALVVVLYIEKSARMHVVDPGTEPDQDFTYIENESKNEQDSAQTENQGPPIDKGVIHNINNALNHDLPPIDTNHTPPASEALSSLDGFKACLKDATTQSEIQSFVEYLDRCLKPQSESRTPEKRELELIPLKEGFNQSECVWLTVGAEKLAKTEQKFKLQYPNCTMYGVPVSEEQSAAAAADAVDAETNADLVTNIPFNSGIDIGSLLRGDAYVQENESVTVYPVSESMNRYMNHSVVHYVSINLDDSEYPLLDQLFTNGQVFSQGIVFCVVQTDFRQFREPNEKLRSTLARMLEADSEYLPYSNSAQRTHHRVNFVNVKQEKCAEALEISNFINKLTGSSL